MANDYFQFKRFTVWQHGCAMKVCTDSCILGAYTAHKIKTMFDSSSIILDAGGGTGLLSLMLAQQTDARIKAIELDETAYFQMKENFHESPWSNRLTAVWGDVRAAEELKYDFVISNPPFFENDLKTPDRGKTLAHHDSGLLLSELGDVLAGRLKPNGKFSLMIPFERSTYMQQLLHEKGLFIQETLTVSHSEHHEPFRSILFGGVLPSQQVIDKVFHINDGSEYSSQMKQLLKHYYLKL